MAFNIDVAENAELDIDKAYLYYLHDKNSPQSAANFYNRVLEAFDAIAINPYYKVYHNKYRGFPLGTFPYIVFFEVFEQSNTVKILAVFNTPQDTSKYPD